LVQDLDLELLIDRRQGGNVLERPQQDPERLLPPESVSDGFVRPGAVRSFEERSFDRGELPFQRFANQPSVGLDLRAFGLCQTLRLGSILEHRFDRSPTDQRVEHQRPVAHLGDGRPRAHGAGSPNARRKKSSSTRSSATESSSIPPMCEEFGSRTRSWSYPLARRAADSWSVFATKTLSSASPCINRSDRWGSAVGTYVTSELHP